MSFKSVAIAGTLVLLCGGLYWAFGGSQTKAPSRGSFAELDEVRELEPDAADEGVSSETEVSGNGENPEVIELEPSESPNLEKAFAESDEEFFKSFFDSGGDPNMTLSNGRPLMHEMISHGFRYALELALENGGDPNIRDDQGNTLIMSALMAGGYDSARVLMEKGVRLDATNQSGESPLTLALTAGQDELAQQMIDQGAELSIDMNDLQKNPLYRALNNENEAILELIVKNQPGALSAEDDEGRTILFHACGKPSSRLIRTLLAQGVDRTHADAFGLTASQHARKMGFADCAEMIEQL